MSLAGRTLGDRYDVLELIGISGMGARELDELVALKVIRAEAGIVERFRSEVKLAPGDPRERRANVRARHGDDVMFCTMEVVDGESLTKWLRRDRKLAVADAVAIAVRCSTTCA